MSTLNKTFGDQSFENFGIGIVHFGTGAFHRAHQAVYTHDVLTKHGGDWKILGVSLQSTKSADTLNAQDCVYSLVTRKGAELKVDLIKSIAEVKAAVRGREEIFNYLADENTHIVSMTVTEKAYGILHETGKLDTRHEAIAHDLQNQDEPIGIIGIIVKGLRLRKAKNLPPFTVLCCDNLPQNGDLVKSGILDFANKIAEHELAVWIEQAGAFPNTMVDRITPATPDELITEVSNQLGVMDNAPVEAENFSQWVIEDSFSSERPKWEDVGVLFVEEVAPYEQMKLRMLNGAHSLLAYVGFLRGHKYVRDVMADKKLNTLVSLHIKAASKTLDKLEAIDFTEYGQQLVERFENVNLAHETYQIAMDGSQKLPQRIFEPALESIKRRLPIDSFALATAVWFYYCSQTPVGGKVYELRDPRADELFKAYQSGNGDPAKICTNFFKLPDLFPEQLAGDAAWKTSVETYLSIILKDGLLEAVTKTLKANNP